MGKFLSILLIVTHAVAAVGNAESQLAGQPGTTKKEAALAAITTAASSVIGDVTSPTTANAFNSAIGSIVDGIAGLANLIGIFKHATPTP